MHRRAVLAAVLAAAFIPAIASASAPVPFDDQAFNAAQAAGKSILVQVHADWCPQCAAQRPIIKRLSESDRFKDMVIFNIDFDTQKPLARRFSVQRQGTLVVFKGNVEKGRSVGATQPDPITELLASAL